MMVLLLWSCDSEPLPASVREDSGQQTDTASLTDADGDGHSTADDCNDEDATVYPGATEACNGVDDDCDGMAEDNKDGVLDCETCDNSGYWYYTNKLSDEAGLIAVLETLYTKEACIDYSAAREYLFLTLDNHEGSVEGLYTGTSFAIGDTLPDWDEVNTEHVWPRSAGADLEPQECDLHHLFTTDASANNRRSSLPFGEVLTTTWSSGGSLAGLNSSGQEVFEPRDEKKGDVARAMLYFSVRYPKQADTEAQRTTEHIEIFQRWHENDPPDDAERERSERIAAVQGWGNPMVVCPELVDIF